MQALQCPNKEQGQIDDYDGAIMITGSCTLKVLGHFRIEPDSPG